MKRSLAKAKRGSPGRKPWRDVGGRSQSPEMRHFTERVYRLVAAIPPGRVATYGQLAALAGHPRRARHVGNALAAPDTPELPWHRVINAQGRISRRGGDHRSPAAAERLQRRLLREEGVVLRGGRIDLDTFRWRPEEDGGALFGGMIRGAS